MQEKFSFFFTVMDSKKLRNFRNDSIYTVQFTQYQLDLFNGNKEWPLEGEGCTKESFAEDIPKDIIDTWNWNDYWCLKRGSNATLKGSDMDLSNYFVGVTIFPCDRSKKGHKCGTEEEISYYLSNTLFQSFVIDKYVNALVYENPIQYFVRM